MKLTALTLSVLALLFIPASAQAKDKEEYTEDFPIEDCEFVTTGGNRYFKLEIGRELHFDNANCVAEGECDELEELIITVLDETHDVIMDIDETPTAITTRVIEEREWADEELAEVSRNFVAECDDTGDIYYFGEKVDDYEDGQIVGHEGAWEAGVDDARPGILVPGGAFLLGARYFQEIAPDLALDRAEHAEMGLEIGVPAGDFEDCVLVEETTPLERKELSEKVYCPDIGLVIDDDLELTAINE